MIKNLGIIVQRRFCELAKKNIRFQQKLTKYEKQFKIHKKISDINQQKMAEYVATNDQQKIAYDMAKSSSYDSQLKDFISKFNDKHKDQITMLDFSKYTTQFGELRNKPLKKQDLDVLKQFQKRKVDQRIAEIRKNLQQKNQAESELYQKFPEFQMFNQDNLDEQKLQERQKQIEFRQKQKRPAFFPDQAKQEIHQPYTQGPLKIKDTFVVLLLNVKSNTKVTTLNRINTYKTLLFMGNGNGIISYAKGTGKTPTASLQRAMFLLKKNLIAIPRDMKCSLPRPIKTKFQDYTIYLRPLPSFNSHGHPTIALMLTLAGMDHCGFKVAHTEKNVYNVLKVMFKAVTKNTTPQQLAQREGFKVYRHQFIRPLTVENTHGPISR